MGDQQAPGDHPRHAGRPRNAELDHAILGAALREIAAHGVDGFSLAAVAAAAGTTRPAIYRRWPTKLALAIDAVSHLAEVRPPEYPGRPFDDLVAELEHFRHCISDACALPLAAAMLSGTVDPALFEQYQQQLVVPRRTRLRAILQSAVERGELDPAADLAMAGTFFTGSWYSLAITGTPPPADWAHRIASLVWTACGGTAPAAADPPHLRPRRKAPTS